VESRTAVIELGVHTTTDVYETVEKYPLQQLESNMTMNAVMTF
jgi:hypothetical protein